MNIWIREYRTNGEKKENKNERNKRATSKYSKKNIGIKG